MKAEDCPHGHGEMILGPRGDPLEPEIPYCPECGHIAGHSCADGCRHAESLTDASERNEAAREYVNNLWDMGLIEGKRAREILSILGEYDDQ